MKRIEIRAQQESLIELIKFHSWRRGTEIRAQQEVLIKLITFHSWRRIEIRAQQEGLI